MKKVLSLFFLLLFAGNIFSQPDIAITWKGTLNISGSLLRLVFHITKTDDGKLAASLDSPDQGAKGIPSSSVSFENGYLTMEFASISGTFTGQVNEDFTSVRGEWTQVGNRYPLVLEPGDVSAPAVTDFISLWQGKLNAGGTELRVVVKLYSAGGDSVGILVDSPDQGAKDIPASDVFFNNDSIYFRVNAANAVFTGKLNAAKDTINGTLNQAMNAFPLVLVKTDKVGEVKRPQNPEKPYPYNEEEVVFENKEAGIKLAGTFTWPKQGSKFPAVVLVSGSGPQNRDEELMGHKPFLVWSDYLTRNGIAVLRYDDRGTAKSTGDFASATTIDFTSDALAAVNYLKTRDEVNTGKIGIIGHSEGGLIAPLAANKSKDVAFIVLAAGPGVPGKDLILLQTELIEKSMGIDETSVKKDVELYSRAYQIVLSAASDSIRSENLDALYTESFNALSEEDKQKPEYSKTSFDIVKKTISSPWFRYFLAFDPRPQLEVIKVPVLALLGGNDLQVPPSQSAPEIDKALKKSGLKNYKVTVIPGVNHLFQESKTGALSEYGKIEQTASPKMLQPMTEWIKKVTNH